jgi:nucleoside-diphosphate-sugar epimerase
LAQVHPAEEHSMKYFITGATGFIGGRVARQLREQGHEVIALARSPSKAQDLAELGVTLVSGDITDKESLCAPMEGVDGVFHVAGWYKIGGRDKSSGQKINVEGTRNVLETMKELGIPKGVYTSTLAVFSDTKGRRPDETYRYNGKHMSEYDRTKWAAHYEVAEPMVEDGLPLVTVMPGLVYGPGDTSAIHDSFVQYLQRKLPLTPLKSTYAWAHVDDIARGHILAMEKGKIGESYIIGGEVHTLIEGLAIAEKITGIPAPRLHAAPGMLKAASAMMRVVNKFVNVPAMYDPEMLRITAGVTYLGDNAKAKHELGYTVRPLEEGLRETLNWEMKQLGMK